MPKTPEPPESEQQKRERLMKSARDQGLPQESLLPDYTRACEACGAKPIVPATGLCGPCSFGEADTANGNW